MSCDQNRINKIENLLRQNNENIPTNDLIYYLKCNTKNKTLNENNLKKTEEYLNKINYSFLYENIFTNKGNYQIIAIFIILLLLPFYFFFPQFYKLGGFGFFIGICGFLGLSSKLSSLFSIINNNITTIYIGLTFLIYFIFFIVLNKLNHISLFFISAVLSYLIINYICRLILTVPTSSNPYVKLNTSMNNNDPKNFTEYNEQLAKACKIIIERYRLNLPSGNMLYSYLTIFEIGDKTNIYIDFIVNLLSPLLSVYILWILGDFLSNFNNIIPNTDKTFNLFPLIGHNPESIKYLTCQANYVLPRELNLGLLASDLLDDYKLNDKIYNNIYKALMRISHELLKRYNPKFYKVDLKNNEKRNILFKNLKNNKIFIQLKNLMAKSKIILNENDLNENQNEDIIVQIKTFIESQDIPYKKKTKLYDLLKHIDNILFVENIEDIKYEEDSNLAQYVLLNNTDEIDPEYKKLLNEITTKYIQNFRNNLHVNPSPNESNYYRLLYGYHYNIVSYNMLGDSIKYKANNFFSKILRLLSTWLLLAKPIGSSWIISRYILHSKNIMKVIKNFSTNSTIWKYMSMGIDNSYLNNIYNLYQINNQNTLLTKGLNIFYSLLIFIIMAPILYFYNSFIYGLINNPSWYSFIYQIITIIYIFGSIGTLISQSSLIGYNLVFIGIIVFLIIMIFLITYFTSKK
jgi:hypothetical protein